MCEEKEFIRVDGMAREEKSRSEGQSCNTIIKLVTVTEAKVPVFVSSAKNRTSKSVSEHSFVRIGLMSLWTILKVATILKDSKLRNRRRIEILGDTVDALGNVESDVRNVVFGELKGEKMRKLLSSVSSINVCGRPTRKEKILTSLTMGRISLAT